MVGYNYDCKQFELPKISSERERENNIIKLHMGIMTYEYINTCILLHLVSHTYAKNIWRKWHV